MRTAAVVALLRTRPEFAGGFHLLLQDSTSCLHLLRFIYLATLRHFCFNCAI